MTGRTLWGGSEAHGHPSWQWMVLASLLVHGLGALVLVTLERNIPRRHVDPSVISVRLVGALPGASMVQSSPAGAQSAPAQKSPSHVEERKPAPVKIPIPIPQAERKSVSIHPTEIKPPERTPPARREESKSGPSPKSASSGQGASVAGSELGPKVASAQPGGGGGGKLTAEEARYLQMLQDRIEESWRAYVPSEEAGVLGEVRIQISAQGRIREFTFIKGSGKSHVDSSIVSALSKVTLPPPPPSLAERPLVLRFWPSGPKAS